MKKNVMMRIASFLMVAVLLSTCAISGTFAKYVSSSTATDTARVAKWSVDVGGTDIAETSTFTFDLFNTVNDTLGGGGSAETDVKASTPSETIIAPGTTGTASVVLTNNSEVNAEYAVAFTANENGVPLQWSKDGTTWVNDITALNISTTDIDMGDDATITIHWKWAFVTDGVVGGDQSDEFDTDLGAADSLATVTFSATITATQLD